MSTQDEMLRMLVDDLIALAAPFVDAVRERVSIGRRGLWGNVVDLLSYPFAATLTDDEAPAVTRQRVEHLWQVAVAGTPLDQQLGWVDFTHAGREHTRLRTTACCLAYKWPVDDDHELRNDSCDPQWDRYCMRCPLIPEAETIHRARWWLDHPDS